MNTIFMITNGLRVAGPGVIPIIARLLSGALIG